MEAAALGPARRPQDAEAWQQLMRPWVRPSPV
jgi:hypothetical protein